MPSRLVWPEAFAQPLRRPVKLYDPVRIVGTRLALGPVQCVPERRIGPLPAWRRDVERLAVGQLHPRRDEVKLDPSALGVLMAHPDDVVLLRVHARKGQTLDAVDQVAGPAHVAPYHLGRRMTAPLAAMGDPIGRNLAPAAAASMGELNQHRRAARVLPAGRKAPGRSRSAASRAPQPAPDTGGSMHGRAG